MHVFLAVVQSLCACTDRGTADLCVHAPIGAQWNFACSRITVALRRDLWASAGAAAALDSGPGQRAEFVIGFAVPSLLMTF